MLKYRAALIQNVRVGDLLDLHGDKMTFHARNGETCTPAILDRLEHDFAEVIKVDKAFESVTVLCQFGEITFPLDHAVQVFTGG